MEPVCLDFVLPPRKGGSLPDAPSGDVSMRAPFGVDVHFAPPGKGMSRQMIRHRLQS